MKHLSWKLLTMGMLITGMANPVSADEVQIQVYTIEQRPAAEVMDAIQPFIQADDTISLDGRRIILRSSPTQQALIGDLIRQLDAASTQWQIQLQQLPADAPPPGSRIVATTSRDPAIEYQQLIISDGQPAMIEAGQLTPMASKTRDQQGSRTEIKQQKSSNGFRVIAHALGNDLVRVQLMPYTVNPSRAGGGMISLQQSETVLTVKPGEWTLVGASSNQRPSEGNSKVYRTGERDERAKQIWIRLDSR